MDLSDFSDQFHAAIHEFTIPENSPFAAGVRRAKDILQKPITTPQEAQQALQEITAVFSGEIAQQHPHLVERVSSLLNAETARVQRASTVMFQYQQPEPGTVKVPRSLAMLGLPIPLDTDLSEAREGAIECTIDAQRVYVDRQTVVDFFLHAYGLDARVAPSDQLGKLLECLSKETWQRTVSQARVLELARRIASNLRLFSLQQSEPATPPPPMVSAHQLVDAYKGRTWSDDIRIRIVGQEAVVGGYLPPGENDEQRAQNHEREKQYLLHLVQAHNQQWAPTLSQMQPEDEGFIEKQTLAPREILYVRADLHSDLSSVLAQLETFKQMGYVDEEYRCKPGFHMVFLGDYMDRGANDVEVLTLLLTLRRENPTAVHLIRGNHEDVRVQQRYSNEGPWLTEHAQEFTALYKSLPLAFCTDVKGSTEGPQRAYLCHALISPAVDLVPLFESDATGMVVHQQPVMEERIYEGRSPEAERKQHAAFQGLVQLQLPPTAMAGKAILWSDIEQQTGPSERGVGYTYSPEDIQKWARYNGIKMVTRGHQHEFKESSVARKEGSPKGKSKVLVTTLPVGRASAAYSDIQEVEQGVLYQVAPKVGDWQKMLGVSEGEKHNVRLNIAGTPRGAYEHFRRPDEDMREP